MSNTVVFWAGAAVGGVTGLGLLWLGVVRHWRFP